MSILRSGRLRSIGAFLLLLGPGLAWIAEFITAAAWQHPHYAPLYNWVSHLGLPEHETAFGQVANSPLAWVMNTGWVIYGVVLIVGAALLLDVRRGWRPIVLTALALLSGVGVALVGLVHGSNENVANGTVAFHFAGAQLVMITGNLFAIVAGLSYEHVPMGRGMGWFTGVLGVIGLLSLVVFLSDVRGAAWNIGLWERATIYPIMIGHFAIGTFVWARSRRKLAGRVID